MTEQFQTQQQLFLKVHPALSSKQNEMLRMGYTNVTEEDIWNYLVTYKWVHETGLTLAQIVSDILHADNNVVYEYALNQLKHYQQYDVGTKGGV